MTLERHELIETASNREDGRVEPALIGSGIAHAIPPEGAEVRAEGRGP